MQVRRSPFVFALLLAFCLSVAAQQPAAPTAPADAQVKPTLLPVGPANPDAVTPDLAPLPTPTPVYGRLGLLVETSNGQLVKQ